VKSCHRVGIALVVGALLFGCAATDKRFGDEQWYQKTRATSDKAVSFTKSTASASYQRMQKYLKEKDVLKTFHDSSEHSEAAVLDVLHRAGIGKRSAPATNGKSGAAPSAGNSGISPPAKGGVKAPSATAGGKTPPANTPKTPGSPALARVPSHYEGAYRWPLDAGIVSSEYGERWGKMHKGIDIAASSGEPVYAVAAGEVIYAGDGLRGYGNVVILKHDEKITSLYAHNTALKVKLGDQIKQGDLIALLGSTGHSTGPHVHFEFRQGDVSINPHTLLPQAKNPEAVAAAEEPSQQWQVAALARASGTH